MDKNNKLRTVVCGSRFGQFYLEAVQALSDRFELVGLLAKGSERSKQCAERYGIPLYTEVDQLPDHIDLACVVLRSGVMGGSGTELSLKLLARGIHVIQEQPIHHKDLAACLKAARQNGVHYLTGDLYVHLPAVRRFVACARALLEQQPALYIDVSCATQVSYPLLHILQEALPSTRPWEINRVVSDEGPFQVLTGSLGKIPITLSAHNEVDPHDPDNYLHLLHSLTIGTSGGRLSLVDTHGPVVWHPRLHVPDADNIPGVLRAAAPAHLLENSTQILGPSSAVSYKDILMQQWPRAIGRDLLMMEDMIQGKAVMETRAQQELLCSRQWHDLTHALGYPVLRSHKGHHPLAVDKLIEAAMQMTDEDEDQVNENQVNEDQVNEDQANKSGCADVFTCTDVAEAEVEGIAAGQVRKCVERLDDAALSSMLIALQSQGTLAEPEREYSTADILSAAKVAPRHKPLILRWLKILAERGYLRQHGESFRPTVLITKDKVEQRWQAAMESWGGKLGSRNVIEYLIANAKQLPQLMSDKQQAALLLFPEGRMDIASALYRDTAIARYLNKSVAEAVLRIAAGKQIAAGTSSSEGDSLRILEMGAGTGATTDAVVRSLKTVGLRSPSLSGSLPGLPRLDAEYLFTDITHFFIAAARDRYKDCPWMQFQIVDMDRNLFEQGLKPESMDIVIAAGMLNNARDTDKVVQSLMHCLVPGGWMLVTEPVRDFTEMFISQAFMMTPPEDDRKNTDTSFMSVKQWFDVFRRAGVQEMAALPDETHPLAPLGQKLFVVRKRSNV